MPEWRNGRRSRLKICRPLGVRVQVPSPVLASGDAERCQSGLSGTPGERECSKRAPWVQIPPSPPFLCPGGDAESMRGSGSAWVCGPTDARSGAGRGVSPEIRFRKVHPAPEDRHRQRATLHRRHAREGVPGDTFRRKRSCRGIRAGTRRQPRRDARPSPPKARPQSAQDTAPPAGGRGRAAIPPGARTAKSHGTGPWLAVPPRRIAGRRRLGCGSAYSPSWAAISASASVQK